MRHTIPYGRSLSINYYSGNVAPDQIMHIEPHSLGILLSHKSNYDNQRNVWVSITIANTLQHDNRIFNCILEPKNNTYTVISSNGDVLRFKLYDDRILIQL